VIYFLIPLFFLIGSISLSAFAISLHRFGLIQGKEEFTSRKQFYCIPLFVKRLFPKEEWENLFFTLSFSKQISRLAYATSSCILLLDFNLAIWPLTGYLALLISIPLIFDLLFRLLSKAAPRTLLRLMTPCASLFLLIYFPITYLFLKLQRLFAFALKRGRKKEQDQKLKEKILEIVHESDIAEELSTSEQNLITSVATFKDRIVREVMVPRIDVFSLPADVSIAEAAEQFKEEEYSRIPIYQDTVDQIIGVVHYKDLLALYLDKDSSSNAEETPISKIAKPILYTPETKKISSLLTEFRQKHIHMAIVVDEYGGTEGIVSIEDILEELVGEIADEYDTEEEKLFTSDQKGGYFLDAKMTINDCERELGLAIPPSLEYDTVGGYVFHMAGMIPQKGFKIHHDNFDLEVMSSSERAIEKILITPISK